MAEGLRLEKLPKAADASRPTRTDLPASPALSIFLNGPDSFAGRKVGALVSDGADAKLFKGMNSALEKERTSLKVVAPRIGGVKASDGTMIGADEAVDGGPSVLFDAVALLLTEAGAQEMCESPAAKEFVADAYVHHKFIAHTGSATALLETAGIEPRQR